MRRQAWMLKGLTLVGAALGAPAAAQFSAPNINSSFVERLMGTLMSAEGEPAPAEGDQIAVFFDGTLVGLHTFLLGQDDPREFNILVYGDDPETPAEEGPDVGQAITFRFFDESTNTTRTDVRPLNTQGEVINLTFQGEFTFQFPIEIPGAPPFPDAPSRTINARLGGPGSGGNGDGDGDGNGSGGGNPDVNGDGNVTKEDAALVLRIMSGVTRGLSAATVSRADVNNDDVVNAADAIQVLRTMRDG